MTRLQLGKGAVGWFYVAPKIICLDQVSILTSRRNFLSLQVLCRIRGFRDLVQTICIYYITHGLLQIQSLQYYSSFYAGLLDDQIDFNSISNHTKYSPINYSFQPCLISNLTESILIYQTYLSLFQQLNISWCLHLWLLRTLPFLCTASRTTQLRSLLSHLVQRRDRIEENVQPLKWCLAGPTIYSIVYALFSNGHSIYPTARSRFLF